jgi:hypothetical protein
MPCSHKRHARTAPHVTVDPVLCFMFAQEWVAQQQAAQPLRRQLHRRQPGAPSRGATSQHLHPGSAISNITSGTATCTAAAAAGVTAAQPSGGGNSGVPAAVCSTGDCRAAFADAAASRCSGHRGGGRSRGRRPAGALRGRNPSSGQHGTRPSAYPAVGAAGRRHKWGAGATLQRCQSGALAHQAAAPRRHSRPVGAQGPASPVTGSMVAIVIQVVCVWRQCTHVPVWVSYIVYMAGCQSVLAWDQCVSWLENNAPQTPKLRGFVFRLVRCPHYCLPTVGLPSCCPNRQELPELASA